MLVLKESKENKYIAYLHNSDHLLRIVANPASSEHQASYELLREVWAEALSPQIGDINKDPEAFDDLMAWVTFRISILMKLVDVADLSEERTKRLIRRFALGRG